MDLNGRRACSGLTDLSIACAASHLGIGMPTSGTATDLYKPSGHGVVTDVLLGQRELSRRLSACRKGSRLIQMGDWRDTHRSQ
jgi:hypothetical protein